MGLIAKSQTKKRVAAVTGPVNAALVGSPWLTTGAIPTAALVRSAAFALNLGGANSSTVRGRQSALAMALLTPLVSGSSMLWVETTDFQRWTLALGVPTVTEDLAADWVVELTVDGSRATVSTPNYLTTDGALANGVHHDALRNELLRAMNAGEQTEAGAEAQVTTASLDVAQPFSDRPPAPFRLDFSFVTLLDQESIRERLRYLGHRVQEDSSSSVRWGLGLPQHDAENHVTLTWQPGRIAASAQVSSTSDAARRIASVALRAFIGRALFLLGQADETVAYDGPAQWGPRS